MTTFITNYFSTKRCLEKFRQLVLQGAEPDDMRSLLNMIITGRTLIGHTMSCEHIYRSRPYEKGRLFAHVDELKYPPPDRVQVKGRLNDVGQSIFYGSNTELGTLIEAKPELDRLFVISKIECIRNEQIFLIPVGMKKHNYIQGAVNIDQGARNKIDKLIIDFLHDEMTRPASGVDCYNGAIAFANHFFRVNLTWSDGSDRVGLVYPSAHGQKICNVATYNIAMLPHTFDENYRITETAIYSLIHNPTLNALVLTPLNTGTVGAGGIISWQCSHQEMRQRTEVGIFGLDVTNEYIKRVAKLI